MAALTRRKSLFLADLLLFQRRTVSLNAVSRPESVEHCSSLMERATFDTGNRIFVIQKTLEHLKNDVVKLDNLKVKQVLINDSFCGTGTDGGSLFLYERIPQIKFHNPNIPILCTKDASKPCEVVIKFVNEESITITTNDRSSNNIYDDFCQLATNNNGVS